MDGCTLDIPLNLKQLFLGKLEFNNSDAFHTINEFIAGCPVLEFLQINHCRIICLIEGFLSIRCPLLKSLVIVNTWILSRRLKSALRLHTPNLEKWIYRDSVATGYVISNLKSLTEAHSDICRSSKNIEPDYDYDDDFEYTDDYDDFDAWNTDVSKVVAACSSSKRMFLSECSVIALRHSSLQLPRFEKLTWLSLGSVSLQGWLVLASLLCNAPNLEHLKIQQKVKKSEIGYADFSRIIPRPPVWLELHLKKIEYKGVEEAKDDAKFLKYFLLNGNVLQKVVCNSRDVPIKEVRDIFRRKLSCVTNIASAAKQQTDSP